MRIRQAAAHHFMTTAAILALTAFGMPDGAIGAESKNPANDMRVAAEQHKLGKPDGTRLSLAGTVSKVEDNSFTLDYGKGNVVVEMDDWDWYNESASLVVGDKVTVHGALDDDAFERKTIEASAVYVDKLQTYYYASAADEEGGYFSYPLSNYADDGSWVTVAGRVTSIDGREMIIDTGIRNIHVDTDEMSYNPFSDNLRQVRTGMRVSVYGQVDNADLFEAREIDAISIITLAHTPRG